MESPFKEEIMAVITTDKNLAGGDVPIFYARDQAEKEQIALSLSRILRAMVHELATGVYVIVRH
ncbi:MAG: capping complex subunit for YIEGIA [Syntrophothermus sp.]